MKKLLSLLLCLGLMGLTAACGGSGEPDPESVPAPEIVDSETIRADPFAAYFDLSGLSQETLDGALQDVNMDTSTGEVSVQFLQTLCDGQNLYVAFDINWPQGSDPAAEMIEANLITGDGSTYGGMVSSSQTADLTGSYIVSFVGDFTPGTEASLYITVLGENCVLAWTIENTVTASTVNLEDSEGTVVGQASLTPFSLQFTIDDPYISGIAHGDTIQLLDETGAPLPETWAISGDVSATFLEFFVPMELGTVKTLQVGPYTAHF
ncbi:MAG: hypothetical protein IJO69_05885 [Ruminiclostridium sp.]|nr:hypothetical protein [Ruminiclostridium sp.]MBQ9933348.1 hypothetical protein [Ruminiclostridium sp.]